MVLNHLIPDHVSDKIAGIQYSVRLTAKANDQSAKPEHAVRVLPDRVGCVND